MSPRLVAPVWRRQEKDVQARDGAVEVTHSPAFHTPNQQQKPASITLCQTSRFSVILLLLCCFLMADSEQESSVQPPANKSDISSVVSYSPLSRSGS